MSDDYETTLAQLEVSLQVLHVTQRPLRTVHVDAPMSEGRDIAETLTLNNLPVADEDEGIVGVVENLNAEIPNYPLPRESGVVKAAMRPLSDRMLVECRSSLQGLLYDLFKPPYYRLVVSAGQIDGIVTVSDLNKAPVRVVLRDNRAPRDGDGRSYPAQYQG